MKKWLLLATCLLMFRPASAQDFDTLERETRVLLDQHHVPAYSIVIARGREVIYSEGYGDSPGGPVTIDTPFQTGTLEDLVIGVAAMRLSEAGTLDLNARVQTYLPDFPFGNIVVGQLLSHTSGLSGRVYDPAEPLATAELETTPGTTEAYFEVNTQLMRDVIAAASGQDYEDTIVAEVFEPLGMTNTTFNEVSVAAQPHLMLFGFPFFYATAPSGITTTANDLSRLAVMLANSGTADGRTYLTKPSVEQLSTTPAGVATDRGYGLQNVTYGLFDAVEAQGNAIGYHASITVIPSTQQSIVMLYNTNHLAAHLLLFPQMRELATTIATNNTYYGREIDIPLPYVGYVVAFFAGIGALRGIKRLTGVGQWAEKQRGRPTAALLPGILWGFVPVVLLVFLPDWLRLFTGQAISYEEALGWLPGVMIWFAVVAAFSALTSAARLLSLSRRGAAADMVIGTSDHIQRRGEIRETVLPDRYDRPNQTIR